MCTRVLPMISHGDAGPLRKPLYAVWKNMKGRCHNPTDANFSNYGARGIFVCNEWIANYPAFKSWAVSHGYEESLTIERLDNDGPYCPTNCCWVPQKVNNRNRRVSRIEVAFGERKSLPDWADDPSLYRCISHSISPHHKIWMGYRKGNWDTIIMRLVVLVFSLILSASAALAQSVTVVGPVTPGNIAQFNSTTVIKDSGIPAGTSVVGPGASVVGDLAIWNNTTGTLLKDQSLSAVMAANLCATAGAFPVYNSTSSLWQCSTVAGSQTVLNPLLNFSVSGAQSGTGLFIGAQSGGSGLTGTGPISAGFASITEGTSGSSAVIDKIGWISSCLIAVNDTSGSGCYAGNDTSTVNGSGSSITRLVGRECDMTIKSGAGTVAYRYCFSAVNETNGVGTGSTLDTAFFMGNIGGSAGAWLNGITASNSLGVIPIASTFNWFQCDYACAFTDFAHFPTATVSGDILSFANVTITGAGGATFSGNIKANAFLGNTLNDSNNAHNIISRSGTSTIVGGGNVLTIVDSGASTFTGSVTDTSTICNGSGSGSATVAASATG